jgi:hypothetical protein
MCAIRRGRTNGLVEQLGAPATPPAEEMFSVDDFSFGDDFSLTRISIGVPFGSWNQMPFDSTPGGGSMRGMRSASSRSRKRGRSSSNAANEMNCSFFFGPSTTEPQRCELPWVWMWSALPCARTSSPKLE